MTRRGGNPGPGKGGGRGEGGTVMINALMALALAATPPIPLPPSPLPVQDTAKGKTVYVKWCAGCHGEDGKGDGPAAAYMLPRPRDFTGAVYQIRTTANGQLPTDADLMRSIDDGLFGTAMPGWKARLSDAERSEEHTSELQSHVNLVCRLLLEKKKK